MLMLMGLLKGVKIDPVKLVIIVAVIGVVALIAIKFHGINSELNASKLTNSELTVTNSRLSISNEILDSQLTFERNETKRVNDLLINAANERRDAEVIYVDREIKTIEYRNDPNVQHCNLDPKWMQLANEAAVSPYSSGKNGNTR